MTMRSMWAVFCVCAMSLAACSKSDTPPPADNNGAPSSGSNAAPAISPNPSLSNSSSDIPITATPANDDPKAMASAALLKFTKVRNEARAIIQAHQADTSNDSIQAIADLKAAEQDMVNSFKELHATDATNWPGIKSQVDSVLQKLEAKIAETKTKIGGGS